MRFRRNARLDTGQVTDVRGRRMGGGLAVGGGGVGLGVLVVYLLITLLSSSNGGLGQLAPLDDRSVGRGDTPSEVSQECQTGQDANERQDCRIVGVVNSVQRFWDGVFQRSGKQYPYVDTVFFTDQIQTGCGAASSAGRPVLLPPGPARVHRPRLLRRAAVAVRRERRAVCSGLRDRARVRPPCAEPARSPRQHPRRPAGPPEQGRPLGAPGRLLRGRVGGERGVGRC